jgi:Divergent InlB B-repeat domain
MNRKWLGVGALIVCGIALLSSSSCARSQQLTAITISPSAFTYFAPASPGSSPNPIPLTAYGTYIHPPETKDITSQVTWASNQTLVADVSSSGVLTAGLACGTANISATYYTDGNKSGNLMVGFMTVTVEGPASEGCPTGTATQNLSVDILSGGADGTIASSPAGINCGTTCTAAFPTGSTVTLTATPSGTHAFLGWMLGCTSSSGTTCEVTMNSNVIVTASFN